MSFENKNFLDSENQNLPRKEDAFPADLVKKEIEGMDKSSQKFSRLMELTNLALDGVESLEELENMQREIQDIIKKERGQLPRVKTYEELGQANNNKKELTEILDDDHKEESFEIYDDLDLKRPDESWLSDGEILKLIEYFEKREKRKKFEYENPLPEPDDEAETAEEEKENNEKDEIYRLKLEDEGIVQPMEAPGRLDEIREDRRISRVNKIMKRLRKDTSSFGLDEVDLMTEAEKIVQEEDKNLKKVRKEIKELIDK
jgi:hypothetical protein